MKKLLLFLFCIPFLGITQNSHTINTVGNTFDPSSLTITIGDTVTWNNTGGSHNINATQDTFPSNPEGFGNSVSSSAWSFQWVFTLAGTYDYQCDPHAPGMSGVIIANVIPVPGCTDSLACNYDPTATIDDSSCIFPDGCTDSLACNYNSLATCDDGSCLTAYGCMDSLANNYDSLATCANGSCVYLAPSVNLFFSEHAEGSSDNKYFEIYNPTADTVDLTNYAFARVNNTPNNGVGIYEYWVDFDSAAMILPNDVYVVVDPSADSLILIEADMDYGSLSNGDDGFALVYGNNPGSPMSPSAGGYEILDWIGDWNGDPGSGWDVAGVSNATANHTLIRKCPISQGDTSWTNAAGTDPVNSQWIVLSQDDWSDIGQHIILPCNLIYGCMDSLACNYDSNVVIDDGSCVYPGQIYQYNIFICNGDSAFIGNVYYSQAGLFIDSLISTAGCDSIVHTNLTIYSQISLYDTISGGIPDTNVGGGNFYSGSQSLELSCYESSDLVSAVVYSADTILTTFEIRDNNGNLLDDLTVNIIPGGHRIYFNYNMSAGLDYELGVSGNSNDLFRHNSGVNYPYNFGSLAAVTSSSAGGNYYYFFYDIEVRKSPTNYSICDGESITVASSVYNTTGLYTDSLTSSIGCDSLVFTNLVVHPNVSYTNNQTICTGETYLIGGNIYDSTGSYIDSLNTSYGCDSIVTTNLTVLTITGAAGVNPQTICLGDSSSVGTSTYYTAGVYSDTLTSSNGCDSVVTTTLTVLTANYLTYNFGLLDTSVVSGAFSDYDGHLILDAIVPSIIKSATVYSEDTNSVTFELRDASGIIIQDVTHAVYPGAQSLIFDFALPAGNNFQLGVDASSGNIGLFRSNAGSGNSVPYPFNIGAVSITSSNAGNQYYYYYYDIEIMPYAHYEEVYICDGDSIVIAGNIYDSISTIVETFTASNSCDSVLYTYLDFFQSPPLSIGSIPNPPEICLGDTILLEASPGFNSYEWTDGNSVIGQSYILLDSPNVDQWYMVTAVDSNGCVSREDINVYVYQSPPLSMGSNPNPPEICLGDSLVIEATQGFINYWWNTGNPADQDEDRVVVFPTEDFTYVVEALDSNGCEARAEIFVEVDSCITGINDLSLEKEMQLYPNPASEQLTIDFTGKATSIKVYNMLGELVIEKYISEEQSSVQLFVKEWKGAMYSIQLYRENGTITHQVFTVVR